MYQLLKAKYVENRSKSLKLSDIIEGNNKGYIIKSFVEFLSLVQKDLIQLRQEEPFGTIRINVVNAEEYREIRNN